MRFVSVCAPYVLGGVGKMDGCAMFWRSSVLRKRAGSVVSYDDVARAQVRCPLTVLLLLRRRLCLNPLLCLLLSVAPSYRVADDFLETSISRLMRPALSHAAVGLLVFYASHTQCVRLFLYLFLFMRVTAVCVRSRPTLRQTLDRCVGCSRGTLRSSSSSSGMHYHAIAT